MSNVIIFIIVLALIAVAIGPAIRHFKGQGGCCGGDSYKPKKKKLKQVIDIKIFQVEGMHCQNCSNRVMEVLNDIPGISAQVNLKKGNVTVSYAEKVADAVIREKIERAGYTVK